MDSRHIAIAVIVLFLIAAFFLVPSALGNVEKGPGGFSNQVTPTPSPLLPLHPSEQYTIERTLRWVSLVAQVAEDNNNTDLMIYFDIRPEHILSIIAQESMGFVDPHKVFNLPYDRVESVGLMAVAPFVWRGYTKEQLLNPYINVKIGEDTLLSAYTSNYNVEHNYNLRTALALYNCGDEYLSQDRCGSRGGYHYADKILNFWTPHFEEALIDERWKTLYSWSDETVANVDQWLNKFNIGGKDNEGNNEDQQGLVRSHTCGMVGEGDSCHSGIIRNHGIRFSARGRYRSR